MNYTENQLKALPLEERQKLAVELATVKPDDRGYANAKALIEVIKASRGWREPDQVLVEAAENVLVDGVEIRKGQTAKVFLWQYKALSRFFTLADRAAAEFVERHYRDEAARNRAATPAATPGSTAAAGVKAAVAAVLAVLLLLCGSGSRAQQYSVTALGAISNATYALGAAGLNGGTNNIPRNTVSNYAATITFTNFITNSSVIVSNGATVFSYTTNTNTLAFQPGLIAFTKYDGLAVQLSVASTTTNVFTNSLWFSSSNDGSNWVSNAWSLTWTNSGTTPVSVLSNLWPVEYGYFLATTLTNNNTGSDLTNLVVTIAKKPVRSGP